MAWVKLDDGFFRNSKARAAGMNGRSLYLAALCHCAAALTDGHITKADLRVIAAEADVLRPKNVVRTLVELGLWHETEDGWQVNDYNVYQRSAQTVRRERDEARKRAAQSAERARRARDSSAEAAPADAHEETPQNGAQRLRSYGDSSIDQSFSSPLVVSSVSESSSSNSGASDEDDDWAAILAKRRLARREAEIGAVTGRRRWLEATTQDVHGEHDRQATSYLAAHPGATPVDVANHLEPQPETDSDRLLRLANQRASR